MGRAEPDRDREVRAHAHGEQRQAIAGRDLCREREVRRRRFVERRDAHQAGDGEAVFVAAARDEGIGVLRQHARLLRLGAGVDLDEQEGAAALPLDLLRHRSADARPVDRMDGVEQADRLPRLVRLQRSDQVKLEAGMASRAAAATWRSPPGPGSRRRRAGRRRSPERSPRRGKVFETATRVTSSGRRPASRGLRDLPAHRRKTGRGIVQDGVRIIVADP